MGGDLKYKSLGNGKYQLTFSVYRDCSSSGNPALPNTIAYNIFNGEDSSIYKKGNGKYGLDCTTFGFPGTKIYDYHDIPYTSITSVNPSAPHCTLPTGYCIQQGVYIDTVTLGSDTVGYHIVMYLTDRNNSLITNLKLVSGTTNTGMAWYAFIPSYKKYGGVSSPEFTVVPVPYMCAASTNVFNQGLYDPDNDSMVCSLVTPGSDKSSSAQSCNGGTNPICTSISPSAIYNCTYNTGYSLTKPFGTGGTISIDPNTGDFTAYAPNTGYYVIAFSVKTYGYNPSTGARYYLGEIRRDLEYIVNTCSSSSNLPPQFYNDPSGYTRTTYPDSSLCFSVSGYDSTSTDTTYLWASGGPFSTTPAATFPEDTGLPTGGSAPCKVTGKFCWKPSCGEATPTSPYVITFNLANNDCKLTQEEYKIYVKPRTVLNPPTVHCADIINDSTVKLSFDSIPYNKYFAEYKIYRRTGSTGAFVLLDSIFNYKATSWTDSNATNAFSQSYSYEITTTNSCGVEGGHNSPINTIVVSVKRNSAKEVTYSWNSLGGLNKYPNSVWVNTGHGLKLALNTNTLSYSISDCNEKTDVQVTVYDSSFNCTSHSNITDTSLLEDNTSPDFIGKVTNASVLKKSDIILSFKESDSLDTRYYLIYKSVSGGAFKLYDSVKSNGSANYIYNDLKSNTTLQNSYEIAAEDSCENISAVSKIFTPIVLKGDSGEDRSILSWTKFQGYTLDTIEVQKYVAGAWTVLKYLPVTDSTYTDSGLQCGVKFSYRIEGKESGSNIFTLSDSVQVVPFDTIKPAIVAVEGVSTLPNKSITIEFDKNSDARVKTYEIDYSINDGSTFNKLADFTPAGSSPFTYTFTTGNPEKIHYCFQVFAIDSCSNDKSLSATTNCPIWLHGKGLNLSDSLHWSPYVGFIVKNYIVQKLIAGVYTDIDTLSGTDTTYTDTALACNVPEAFRIKAIENGGSSFITYSDTIDPAPFDTIAPPQTNLISSSVINGTTIAVTFAKLADPVVKKYEIFTSTDNKTFSLAITVSLPFASPHTVNITGLNTVKNRYFVQVKALDSCANTIARTSETHSAPYIGGTDLNLSNLVDWNPYIGFTVKSYQVQRLIGGVWKNIATLAGTDTSYTDTARQCGVACYYRVSAHDNGADSGQSYSDTIQLTPFDTIAPQRVNMYSASVISGTTVAVTFAKVSDPEVKTYNIYVSTDSGTYSLNKSVSLPFASPVTVNITGLNTVKNRYYFEVKAVDSCNATILSKTTEVHSPVKISGQALNLANQVNWKAYEGFTVKDYILQRLIGGVWTNLTTLSAYDTTYSDSNIACHTPFYYRVNAIENGGNNAQAYSDTLKLTPLDTIAPPQVNLNYVTVNASGSVYINWSKSSSKLVKQYIVFRKSTAAGAFTVIDTVLTDTFYTDNGINAGTSEYFYAVSALDSCAFLVGAKSLTHNTIFLQTQSIGCHQKLKLSWNVYNNWPSGVSSYSIYKGINGAVGTLLTTVASTVDTFTDTSVSINNHYCYTVVANEKSGTFTSSSNMNCDTTFSPTAPLILLASKIITSATTGEILIKWKSALGSPHIKIYNLYYRLNGTGPYSLLKANIPPSLDSFVHTGLNTTADNYEYTLIATDSCGNISDSSVANETMILKFRIGQLIHRLNWSPYKGFNVKYYIVQWLISGVWTSVDSLPSTDTLIVRQPMPCNHNEYYRIAALSTDGVSIAYSDTAGGKAIDTIPTNAITWKNVTVTTNKTIKLTFSGADSADTYAYAIERSDSGGPLRTINTLIEPGPNPATLYTYIDTVDAARKYKGYVIVALDSCLNATPSTEFFPILLQGKGGNLKNYLYWYPFQGYGIGTYDVLQWSGSAWVNIASLPGNDTFHIHDSLPCNMNHIYKIQGNEFLGARTTLSDSISLTTFDTVAPHAVNTYSASVINSTTIAIVFAKVPDSVVKTYNIYISTDSITYTKAKVITLPFNSPDTVLITGLNTQKNKYFFQVKAIDSCSNILSASAHTHSPVRISGKGQNLRNQINWTFYKGFTVKNYILQKLVAGVWTNRAALAATDTTYTEKYLSCNTPYYYRINAIDNGPNRAQSYSDTIGLTPFDTLAPAKVNTFSASVINGTDIDLIFEGVPDSVVKNYNIYISTDGINYTFKSTVSDPILTVDTIHITGLNTTKNIYFFEVKAVDSCSDTISKSAVVHSPVHVGGYGQDLANHVSWDYYTGFTVKNYVVEKLAAGSWTDIATLASSDSAYTDKNLGCNVPQYYRINTLENGGNNAQSYSDTIKITPFDTVIPPAPILHFASDSAGRGVQLHWNWNTTSNIDRFEIWKKDTSSNTYTLLAKVTNDSTYLDDMSKPLNRNYNYYIRALDSCSAKLRSAPSDTAQTIKLNLSTLGCNPVIYLNWTAYATMPGGVSFYKIYRGLKGGPLTLLKTVGSNMTTDSDYSVSLSNIYTYRIEAVDTLNGYYSYSDTISMEPAKYPKPIPVSLKNVSVLRSGVAPYGAIIISWHPSNTSRDIYVRGYHIYYSQTPGGPFSLLLNDSNLNDSVYLQHNIDTKSASWIYYLAPYNLCNVESAPSIAHESVNLQVINQDLSAKLTWNHYRGDSVDHYYIYKSYGGSFFKFRTINNIDTVAYDSTLRCNNVYHYVIAAVKNDIIDTSWSNAVTITAFDTINPPAPVLKSATILNTSTTNGQVLIEYSGINKPSRYGYYIFCSTNNHSPVRKAFIADTVTTLPLLTYTDFSLDTKDSIYFYYFVALDSCNNHSIPSDTLTLSHLTVQAQNAVNVVSWTPYIKFPNVQYLLLRGTSPFDISDTLGLISGTANIFKDVHATCNVLYYYQIKAISSVGGLYSYSNYDTATAFNHNAPSPGIIKRAYVRTTGLNNGSNVIEWNQSHSPDVAYYLVYRRIPGESKFTQISGNITDSSYVDSFYTNTYSSPSYYRIAVIDSCKNYTLDTLDTHETVNLHAKSGNNEVLINWNRYVGFPVKRYEIFRDGRFLTSVDSSLQAFADTFVYCDSTYHYAVWAISIDTTIISYSNADSAKPRDTKPPAFVYLINATVSIPNDTVKLFWTKSKSFDTKGYYIDRWIGQGINRIGNVTDTTYTDTTLGELKGSACYVITAYDYCDNTSKGSNSACTIYLSGKSEYESSQLEWNRYTVWNDGGVDHYNIWKDEDSLGWVQIATVDSNTLSYNDPATTDSVRNYCYRVDAVQKSGQYNAVSSSTHLCLEQKPVVWIPNAFTPVISPGLNDIFAPKGTWFPKYEMYIYNRWGELIYSTKESKGWDGKFGGVTVDAGEYMYQIVIYDYQNNTTHYKGMVQIVY